MSEHLRGNHRGGYFARPGSGDRAMMGPLHPEPVKTVERPSLTAKDDIAIKHFEHIGSYSWVEARKPTVVIPGSPAYWRDRPLPYQVSVDTKEQFVDQGGERMGCMALYPLIRAVDLESEEQGNDFDWGAVDFVGDRNSLRKLLSWVQDNDGRYKPSRIDTQLVGHRTVLLNRWETRMTEAAGHWPINFQRESTYKPPGYEHIPTVSHHRVAKYGFGGLTMVVRFSVDACTPLKAADRAMQTPRLGAGSADVDSLSSMLSGMSVTSHPARSLEIDREASTPELDIIRVNSPVVPQSSLIEITTRSERNFTAYKWVDTYPQLYFSQTAYRYLAVHQQGNFREVRKHALEDPEMKRIEAQLQGDFRKLRSALQVIQDLVVEHGERGRLSLVFEGGTCRVFERRSAESCLPDTMLRRFEGF
ncbi:hypothetical protein EVJ58_g4108 [Rhodofomes roseus]|uniref:Geranylgeranyl pyrophosphate synthetase n=1 Tax=Rhodofomes roseus TaxID=34475 RepID=A0A4Y9YJ92_9APHY|nr:hypothetical protein EVJ58_g4108 [Rhodofomes roseus]